MRRPEPHQLLELFVAANLGFLSVDIALAHAFNGFARRAEWIPLYFGVAAALLLTPGAVTNRFLRSAGLWIGYAVGALSIGVGVAGTLLHLESQFFGAFTLKSLVYTAPFAAPLAFVGLGLLLIANRMEAPGSEGWAPWVVFLAFGGFVGNVALTLCDHAQNGFFKPMEWVSVVAAAFGTSFLCLAVLRRSERPFLRVCLGVMAFEAIVGVLGFALHLLANLRAPEAKLLDRLVFGAPSFAPLLFADLAALGALGLFGMLGTSSTPSEAESRPAR